MSKLELDRLLHGGDYNPEQWMDAPGIWEEDRRLFRLAKINSASVGIFSWAALEPEEGRYDFGWLDRVMDGLARDGMRIVLATPSGAKPNWLGRKYEEVRIMNAEGRRQPQWLRHNHCPTSPIYREKVALINRRLGQRYGKHPAVVLWHISNEFSGNHEAYCECPLCKAAFREWLKKRYRTLAALNAAWWTRFWSHTYTEWEQVDAIDWSVQGLKLDWRRFQTDQYTDFLRAEIAALREAGAQQPTTTNFMGFYETLDYWRFAEPIDVISWDSYPGWHSRPHEEIASQAAMTHDLNRSFKGGQPFLLMESTPSVVNWAPCSRPKAPGLHLLSSLQAVAHGSDSVQYFQLRKSRGGGEKFHGAVIDHAGHENTRVFREVAAVGEALEKLASVAGSRVPAEVALVFDWEVDWAIKHSAGPLNSNKAYLGTVQDWYGPFWKRGIAVDLANEDTDFSRYRLVVAPMLYLVREGAGERLTSFVEGGGTLVLTYMSGLVNDSDLCFLTGFPGPLRKVAGIWAEEIDVLHPHDRQTVRPRAKNPLGLKGPYAARDYCEIVHAEGAEVVATFGKQHYAGSPALTVNRSGKGEAWYVPSRNEGRFQDDFVAGLARRLALRGALPAKLPPGVSATRRRKGGRDFVFVMNFSEKPRQVPLGDLSGRDLLTGKTCRGRLPLRPFGAAVLETPSAR
jgi:beta-galactosidase